MDHVYEQVLTYMERIVDDLARRVPQPQFVEKFGAFRHVEKSICQAIVQKLARMVSTLHAARLLCNHGFVQEQAALQRILDEIQEDVLFLRLVSFTMTSDLRFIRVIWMPFLKRNSMPTRR